MLKGLPFYDDPRVLVGAPAGDDAGVYKLNDELALVQTVDVFTPSVDDPYTFGQIAAANSLSDVYAMGGRPITALSIVGYPIRTMPDDAMHQILRGGVDKMTEAGVPVVGGHSINDKEIKAGFAVTGIVHPDKIVTNAGARPGDRLILTKPLGTGILAFAAQIGRAPVDALGSCGAIDGQVEQHRIEIDDRIWRACLHRCDGFWFDGPFRLNGQGEQRRCGNYLGRSPPAARRSRMSGRWNRIGRGRAKP